MAIPIFLLSTFITICEINGEAKKGIHLCRKLIHSISKRLASKCIGCRFLFSMIYCLQIMRKFLMQSRNLQISTYFNCRVSARYFPNCLVIARISFLLIPISQSQWARWKMPNCVWQSCFFNAQLPNSAFLFVRRVLQEEYVLLKKYSDIRLAA